MALIRVFASFDYEHDEDLFKRLVADGKAPGAKFVVFDRSMREIANSDSECQLQDRISHVDAVFVLCGVWSHRAPNVNAEIKIAQELGKRYYLLKGRRFQDCARPAVARITDKMFKWTRGTPDELAIRNI